MLQPSLANSTSEKIKKNLRKSQGQFWEKSRKFEAQAKLWFSYKKNYVFKILYFSRKVEGHQRGQENFWGTMAPLSACREQPLWAIMNV